MKGVISVITTLQCCILYAESYNLTCPSQAHWQLRAIEKCNSTLEYFCLYNNVESIYVEGCDGPDWDRKGCKRIYAGYFTRGYCILERFQPFKYWTNESMSDCIYTKSICSEEGQIVYKDDSRKEDRACSCDYTQNYSFMKTPKDVCFCIPTEEDCSCYIKSCPVNFTLSADYECIPSKNQEKPKCIEKTRNSETKDEISFVIVEKDHFRETSSKFKWSATTAVTVVICLCFIYLIGGFFVFVLFDHWASEKIRQLSRYLRRSHKENGNKERARVTVHQPSNISDLTLDDLYFLRMMHLLFRVACPVVRLVFNDEIKPDQLPKILAQYKVDLEKRYRNEETIISDVQWDLLYKGNTVNADDFDIRLLIYLLRTLTQIEIGNLYPVETDKKIGAQLSRIKFIRNETTLTFGRTLSEDKFSQYWDDIGQAVLTLISSHIRAIGNDETKRQLKGRLHMLSPIKIDHKTLRPFITVSEQYPAMVLHQLISEYCVSKRLSIETILKQEKHNLYHKRMKTDTCCECTTEFSTTFMRAIPEKHWDALYETKESSYKHTCPLQPKKCSETFIPKKIDTRDLSVSVPIILYIPNILKHVIKRLCPNGLTKFLTNNKHTIFHSMEKTRCCNCTQDPTDKIVMNRSDWTKLYRKHGNKSCQKGNDDCCCQYFAKKRIKYSKMDDVFLSKLFYIAGPISVLYKCEQDAFSYFLNWTVDDQPLRKVVLELLKTVNNEEFRHKKLQEISYFNKSHLENSTPENADAHQWVSRHILDNKIATEPQLQIIVRNKDGLNVKSVHIPKDYSLPHRTRKFTDLTEEENNFLVVVYGLSKIVYPVIKKEFDSKCPDSVLNEICMDIYEQYCKYSCKSKKKSRTKRIYLTQKQQEQLFPSKKEESKTFDLKLMIFLLKQRPEVEGKKDDDCQLDVIDSIRREIVQSSSGILDETKFKDIMDRITKAILHLGGQMYEEKLLNLYHVRNILE